MNRRQSSGATEITKAFVLSLEGTGANYCYYYMWFHSRQKSGTFSLAHCDT